MKHYYKKLVLSLVIITSGYAHSMQQKQPQSDFFSWFSSWWTTQPTKVVINPNYPISEQTHKILSVVEPLLKNAIENEPRWINTLMDAYAQMLENNQPANARQAQRMFNTIAKKLVTEPELLKKIAYVVSSPKWNTITFPENREPMGWGNPNNRGIENYGSSCFINASLQCFFKTQPLNDILQNQPFLAIQDQKKPFENMQEADWLWMQSMQKTACEFKKLQRLPTGLLQTSSRLTKETLIPFTTALQESAQCCNIFLNAQGITNVTTQQQDGSEFINHAITTLQQQYPHDNNPINNLFNCLVQSTRTCSSCRLEKTASEPYGILTIPLPLRAKKSPVKLDQLFNDYFKPEDIEEICDNCSEFNEDGSAQGNITFSKKMTLQVYSPVLIIKLIREAYDKETLRLGKRTDKILFSRELQLPEARYSLYAFIQHTGASFNQGHYIAYARNYDDNQEQWHRYDDSIVRPVYLNDTLLSNPENYIAFYQRIPNVISENDETNPHPTTKKRSLEQTPEIVNLTEENTELDSKKQKPSKKPEGRVLRPRKKK